MPESSTPSSAEKATEFSDIPGGSVSALDFVMSTATIKVAFAGKTELFGALLLVVGRSSSRLQPPARSVSASGLFGTKECIQQTHNSS